jgi:SAM-dependent methyltransferase
MNNQSAENPEARFFFLAEQEVVIDDFDAPGWILDIGGGGEGVIGRLKGEQVIAIDPNKRELEEAPVGPLKVVMDATDLQFLECTFSVATSFFTLMYIEASDHETVFSEVFRVLHPGGLFFIWDAMLAQRPDTEKDAAIVSLLIKLPNEEITAGYGYYWPEEQRDLFYYVHLAENAGFDIVAQRQEGRTFFLRLQKP